MKKIRSYLLLILCSPCFFSYFISSDTASCTGSLLLTTDIAKSTTGSFVYRLTLVVGRRVRTHHSPSGLNGRDVYKVSASHVAMHPRGVLMKPRQLGGCVYRFWTCAFCFGATFMLYEVNYDLGLLLVTAYVLAYLSACMSFSRLRPKNEAGLLQYFMVRA